jgi:hypothetical protein
MFQANVKGGGQVSDERDPDGEAIIGETVRGILHELVARLRSVGITPQGLGESAQAAIRAAVEKAAAEGFNLGCQKVAFEVVERGYTLDLVLQPLSVEDVWDQHYGEENREHD